MPISPHLTKALRLAIGDEASEELLRMFQTNDSDHTAIRGDIADVRGDMAELRHEMQVGFEKVRTEMAELRADLTERIESRFSDLLKWSFIFWVGAVTTIAVVVQTLR